MLPRTVVVGHSLPGVPLRFAPGYQYVAALRQEFRGYNMPVKIRHSIPGVPLRFTPGYQYVAALRLDFRGYNMPVKIRHSFFPRLKPGANHRLPLRGRISADTKCRSQKTPPRCIRRCEQNCKRLENLISVLICFRQLQFV